MKISDCTFKQNTAWQITRLFEFYSWWFEIILLILQSSISWQQKRLGNDTKFYQKNSGDSQVSRVSGETNMTIWFVLNMTG